MKRMSLGAMYEIGLLVVMLLIVVHAPVSVWLGTIFTDHQALIKAWKELLLAALAVVAVILITKRGKWKSVIYSPFILLSLAFIDVHLLLALFLGGESTAIVAGLMIDLRFVVMFMLMYVLILLRPQALKRVFVVAASGALVVVGFGLLQITILPDDVLSHIGYKKNETIAPFITIDANPDYVRINSTLRGPNPLGALLVIYISLAAAYLFKKYNHLRIRRTGALVVGIVAGAAVLFASYSRSAYLAVATALLVVFVASQRLSKTLIIGAAGAACIGGVVLLSLQQSDWFSNVILHENPQSASESKSNDEHAQSLVTGWQRMIAEPFGHGIGSTGSASLYDNDSANDIIIENNYFFVAHEAGWLGVGLFVGLFGYVLYVLWRRREDWRALGLLASGIGLALIGVLLPVWTDETVALIWWGLAGALLAAPTRESALKKSIKS